MASGKLWAIPSAAVTVLFGAMGVFTLRRLVNEDHPILWIAIGLLPAFLCFAMALACAWGTLRNLLGDDPTEES